MAQDGVVRTALAGYPAGWFAPSFKFLEEPWDDISRTLGPIVKSSNKTERRIRLHTGGVIDFWSLEDPDAGRSRKYKHAVIDEAAKARHLETAWNEGIRPTLSDYQGTASFFSTPRGRDFFWKLFTRGQDPLQAEYESWQLPTSTNPYIAAAEIEAARLQLPERSFQQEYLAIFLEDAGGVFRKVRESIDQGRGAPEPKRSVGAYCLGVDLARLEDFTVLCVLNNQGRQVYWERFNRVDWEFQIAAIKRVADLYNAAIVVDATGVGDPIYQRLVQLRLNVQPYTLTSQSKKPLIDALAMAFEGGKLSLMDIPEQEAELVAYEYQFTKSRNWTANAPEGMHDDCVIALALAYHGSQSVRQSWGLV